MSYLVYLVSTDESATILNEPVYKTEEALTELPDSILLEIVVGLLRDNGETLPEDVTTGVDALEWMREECIYYSEDLIVFVEDKNNIREKLAFAGDAMGNTMGDDSSCYRAAASWSAVVQSHGVSTIEI